MRAWRCSRRTRAAPRGTRFAAASVRTSRSSIARSSACFRCVAVDPARLAVGGFSDGATYALSLGLINGDLFRRVVAFSPGFIVEGETHGKPRFFVSHGTSDDILPIDRCSRRMVPELRQRGYDVTFREFDGGHEMPPAIASEGMAWLAGKVAPRASFPDVGRADGGDAHRQAVHRSRVDVRAQARRHPRARVQARIETSGCSRATSCRSTARIPRWLAAIGKLPVRDVILDGEATGAWGRQGDADYHVFDILWIDGRDLTGLHARRAPHAARVDSAFDCRSRASQPLDDEKPWERACAEGLGRRDREAARLDLRAPAIAALAEDEVRGDAGARDRRLHRSAAARASGSARCWSATSRRTTSSSPARSGPGFDTKTADGPSRERLDALEIARHRSRRGRACRGRARTGCVRRSSCRSRSSSGPSTASFVIRGCSASGPTRPRARS